MKKQFTFRGFELAISFQDKREEKEAERVYEKFKKGESLSLEELETLREYEMI